MGRTPLTDGKEPERTCKKSIHRYTVSMQKTTPEAMDASSQCCPNLECIARGKVGQGTIVSHGCKRPRYRCKICGKTFSAKEGTMFAGLRTPTEVVVLVVTLVLAT